MPLLRLADRHGEFQHYRRSRKKGVVWLFGALALAALLGSGCQPVATGTPPPGPYYTAAARTVMARLTQAAGATAVTQLTEMSRPATVKPTDLPPAPLPTATPTPQPATPTVLPVSATPTLTTPSAACDLAEFVGDVTVPDHSEFVVGASFIKTWRLKNAGICAWTSAYDLVFVDGEQMGTATSVPLPGAVSPGAIVDLSVDLIAPLAPGDYSSQWMLRNAAGVLFGIQAQAASSLEVSIRAILPSSPVSSSYDFAADLCAAQWASASGSLSCPASAAGPDGAVRLLTQPNLETGREDGLALWTLPNRANNGWIRGWYPPYLIQERDRFRARLGCLSGSQGCRVSFQLDYLSTNGATHNLGTWEESYDGQDTTLDIDLSALAGRQVQFVFSVYNDGLPAQANAYWFEPRIENVSRTELVYTWNEQAGDSSECRELRLYLTDRQVGEAQAYNCAASGRFLGWTALTPAEVDQVNLWVDSLQNFSGEFYQSSSPRAVIAWIDFYGRGSNEARDGDIRAMSHLAASLFADITAGN